MNATFQDQFLSSSTQSLFRAVDEFNRMICRYIHPSRLAQTGIPEEIYTGIKDAKRLERRLSVFLLSHFNLAGNYIYDFESPVRRLALLPADKLQRLVFYAGITINAKTISHVISRKILDRIKLSIGAAGYQFAMRKAQFLADGSSFSFNEPLLIESITSKQIMDRGLRCLSACLVSQPDALIKRTELKLHQRYSLKSGIAVGPKDQNRAWLLVKKILLYEIEPQWKQFI
ncbi:MAG: YscK family type III secretion system sorting platform protein [Desulfobacteraceae bacterium]|nr:YscK family type III secretion system sorting platform protein [Desulfobacteraceae bacterium]